MGANPVPILVPCHRVLASDGRITGYSAGEGVATKAWLLEHEGIPFRLPSTREVETAVELALGLETGAAESAA
ncbi:methylated-DNA--[protein]-cysteine S-methyltransferase [Schumannella soli]|uniref:methylated-DNA--[protein]-cysteine S-methyltransferase n=1 Tax=Schumannella soli TaxID=2590779 RepID=UPI0021049EA8|nr:MGMT family protein [Schumannella soli]